MFKLILIMNDTVLILHLISIIQHYVLKQITLNNLII